MFVFNFQASLTYAEAQLRIDDEARNDEITKSLRGLNRLAKILKKKRIDKGCVVSKISSALRCHGHFLVSTF